MVRVGRRFIFQSHGGKQTIENVQMFQLGNKLARLLNNKEYSRKASIVWKWINNVNIINMTTYQVLFPFSIISKEQSLSQGV